MVVSSLGTWTCLRSCSPDPGAGPGPGGEFPVAVALVIDTRLGA